MIKNRPEWGGFSGCKLQSANKITIIAFDLLWCYHNQEDILIVFGV